MAGETDDAGVRSLTELLNPLEMAPRHQLGILGLVLLVVVPFGVSRIDTYYLTGAMFFAVFVMSWDVVSGYTGEISFGHGLFFGVGGYSAGMMNLHFGVDPWLAMPVGMVAAALAGLIIGFPALRLKGPYFALVTLVAPLIVLAVFRLYPGVTGGELGLVSVGTIDKFSRDLLFNYYVALVLFVGALVVFLAVTRSDAGIVFTAIREDETAVSATGINPAKFKLFAFLLAGAVGGLAGAVYVFSRVGNATPSELLALVISIEVIIATILGGIGTITGAAIGGMFFYLLRTWLRNAETVIPLVNEPVGNFYFLIFLVVTLGFLFFLPEGIVPRLVRTGRDRLGTGGEGGGGGGETRLERIVQRWADDLRELVGGGRE